jgi:hypothetical protein
MKMILGMPLEPTLHGGRLVRPVVVQHDVDLDTGSPLDLGVDLVEELEELPLPVPPVALADHRPGGHIQRGERRGRPIADVVGSPPPGLAGRHRQRRLGAVQRLYLALLIDRQDDGVLRRAHVQTDHVADLLDEVGIGGEFEGLAPVGLRTEGVPDPDDRTLGRSHGLGHAAGAPVGGGLGLLFQGLGDDLLDLRVEDRARGTGPRFVGRPFEAILEETFAPLADGHGVDVEPGSDLLVVQALGAGQDDPGAGGEALCARRPARPGLELLPLVVGEDQGSLGATALALGVHHIAPLGALYDKSPSESRLVSGFLTQDTSRPA